MTRWGSLLAVSLLFLASCAGGPSTQRTPVSPKGSIAPPPAPPLKSVNLIVFRAASTGRSGWRRRRVFLRETASR